MTSPLDRYHEGLAAGELRLPRCESCERTHWPPREICPRCLDSTIVWERAPERATVHTWTVVHRTSLPAFADLVPYAVAVLSFDQLGVRVIGRIEGPPQDIRMGAECTWTVQVGPDGTTVPLWSQAEKDGR